jgi:hypothetical protein
MLSCRRVLLQRIIHREEAIMRRKKVDRVSGLLTVNGAKSFGRAE